MAPRVIHLLPFCSAKGGVGKSTLAVAAATLLAGQGKRVVVLDLDMTGTSLADGLKLLAPDLPVNADGTLDLTAVSSDRWLSLEATHLGRRERALAEDPRGRFILFLNDIFEPEGIAMESADKLLQLEGLLWRNERDDGVRYLPSSPVARDVVDALYQLYIEEHDDWERQLSWLMYRLADQLPDLDVIVLDLPPGLHGFADRALHAAACLALNERADERSPPVREDLLWKIRPVLVTSQDWNDLRTALDWHLLYDREQLPNVVPVVNRTTVMPSTILERVRAEFDPLPVHEWLHFVHADPRGLGLLFWEGRLDMNLLESSGLGVQILNILTREVT